MSGTWNWKFKEKKSMRLETRGVGKYPRRNCCYAVALSVLLDLPFEEIDEFFIGRHSRAGGMNTYELTKIIEDLTGREFRRPYKTTLNQFMKLHPKGSYYVHIRGHAMAIIDGGLYDNSRPGKTTRVHSYLRFN